MVFLTKEIGGVFLFSLAFEIDFGALGSFLFFDSSVLAGIGIVVGFWIAGLFLWVKNSASRWISWRIKRNAEVEKLVLIFRESKFPRPDLWLLDNDVPADYFVEVQGDAEVPADIRISASEFIGMTDAISSFGIQSKLIWDSNLKNAINKYRIIYD